MKNAANEKRTLGRSLCTFGTKENLSLLRYLVKTFGSRLYPFTPTPTHHVDSLFLGIGVLLYHNIQVRKKVDSHLLQFIYLAVAPC